MRIFFECDGRKFVATGGNTHPTIALFLNPDAVRPEDRVPVLQAVVRSTIAEIGGTWDTVKANRDKSWISILPVEEYSALRHQEGDLA